MRWATRLGLDDSYLAQDRDRLMYGFLTKGERRLPTRQDAEAASHSAATWRGRGRARALPFDAAHHRHSATGQVGDSEVADADHEPDRHPDLQPGNGLGHKFLGRAHRRPNGRRGGRPDRHGCRSPTLDRRGSRESRQRMSASAFLHRLGDGQSGADRAMVSSKPDGVGAFNQVAGATADTLTIVSPIAGQDGNVYHAVYSNAYFSGQQRDHQRRGR